MTEPLAAALAHLEAVALDVLIESADLQTRRDRKYLVPMSMLGSLLEGTGLKALDIDGKRSFHKGIGFSTPIEIVERVVTEIVATGKASQPLIGIGGTTAFAAMTDGEQINTMAELIYDIRNHSGGDTVTLTLTSDGAETTVSVMLGNA